MLYDTIVCVDHFFQMCKVFTYLKVPSDLEIEGRERALEEEYERCRRVLQDMAEVLNSREVPLPEQGPIQLDQYTSHFLSPLHAILQEANRYVQKNDIQHRAIRLRIPRHTPKNPHLQRRHHPSRAVATHRTPHLPTSLQHLPPIAHRESIPLPLLRRLQRFPDYRRESGGAG